MSVLDAPPGVLFDPDEERELAAIDAWEAREAAGETLPETEPRRGGDRSAPRNPIGPFRAFLCRLAEEAQQAGHPWKKTIAKRLGVGEKTVWRWLYEATEVEEHTVEMALIADGRFLIGDLYPVPRIDVPDDFAAIREDGEERRGCGDPECEMEALPGRRFCEEHGSELARIREELKDDAREVIESGSRRSRKRGKGRPKTPICCNPSCFHEREAGERFCHDCVDDGWTEEIYE